MHTLQNLFSKRKLIALGLLGAMSFGLQPDGNLAKVQADPTVFVTCALISTNVCFTVTTANNTVVIHKGYRVGQQL